MYDMKRAGATIPPAFLSEKVRCHAGKDFWILDSNPSVVENVLGQLTESRERYEDRR